MFAIKACYKHGHIALVELIPDSISSADFKAIGLNNFFDTLDHSDVDWEKFFALK